MLWGGEPPGGGRPTEDTGALRAKMRGSIGGTSSQIGVPGADDSQFLRIEVEALRAENQVLRQATGQAHESSSRLKAEVAELQQRLLRCEAENSTLHESLREAQDLLEEAASDTPNLAGKLGAMRASAANSTAEVAELYDALKAAQRRSLGLEQEVASLLLEEPERHSGEESVVRVQEYINALRGSLASARKQIIESGIPAAKTPLQRTPQSADLHPPPTVGHAMRGRVAASQLQQYNNITDPAALRGIIEDLLGAEESQAGSPDGEDRELIGASSVPITTEDKIARYRARMRQILAELEEVREENSRLQEDLQAAHEAGRGLSASALSGGAVSHTEYSPHVQQIMRELAEYRTECARLREDKQRLLQAVKQASNQVKLRDDMMAQGAGRRYSEASSDVSYFSDDSNGGRGGRDRNYAGDVATLREERDRLVDQLVAARAAAHAAELLKQDSQDERRDLLGRLEAAHTKIAELQHRVHLLQKGPERSDRAVSPFNEKLHLPLDHLGDLPDLEEEGLDVTPAVCQAEEEDKRQGVDEYALESLRHVLHQTQQLLERSDQQLLDERDKNRLLADQLEDMRTALEKTLKEGAELQHERDTLIVERDQWAQAARDADDARRKLVEHVELLQAGTAAQRDAGGAKTPEVADLLREKAELLVQIDILKERLADAMEELEGARRELVSSLDARSELQREQDKNADMMNSLRNAEAERDKLEQEKDQLEEEAKHLHYQLENANLVKKCSGERLEQMKREVDEMKAANTQLRRELEAQMKEIAFLCDTLTETSAQYEDCAQKLEQAEAEKTKLLAEKHSDLQRIEELSGKLTEVRLQNDNEAAEERRQLQTEREFDAMMLADRMRELQECKDEIVEVKSRATKAINVLKASLQNALLQMKNLGDEFEVERAELQEALYSLDKQHREKVDEVDKLRDELGAQLKKDGSDRLRERIDLLSQGLQETKERFAEQTQAYERSKGELRATRQQLAENADYRSLFEEANTTLERLTQRNKEYVKENQELRERIEHVAEEEGRRAQRESDEITLALREQIGNLQTELKREKDLRLRLREQNERIKKEQRQYEGEMSALVADLTSQLETKALELDKAMRRRRKRSKRMTLDSNATDADGGDDPNATDPNTSGGEAGSPEPTNAAVALQELELRLRQLQIEKDARDRDVEDLAAELESHRHQSKELISKCTQEYNLLRAETEDALRVVRRIETLAASYTPAVAQHAPSEADTMPGSDPTGTPLVVEPQGSGLIPPNSEGAQSESQQESAAKAAPPIRELPAKALDTVRSALEHMKARCDGEVVATREEMGQASAEFELAKIDIVTRMQRAEDARAELLDELNTVKGENKRFRDENAAIRLESIGLVEQNQALEGYRTANESLQAELRDVLTERDTLLHEAQEGRSGQSHEIASLLEAREVAMVAMEKLQRDAQNAQIELEHVKVQNETAQKVIEGLQDSLRTTETALNGSEKSVSNSRRERDEAGFARDRAVREAQDAVRAAEEVRAELIQTKADFARLQAVCQDLDGLNAMIDETQEELMQTREQLSATQNELQRLRLSRDAEVAECVKEEKARLDGEMRDLLREKEELRREADAALRGKESAERGAAHGLEKSRIEQAQQEEATARLQGHVDHLQVLCEERLQQIDALQKDNLMLQARQAIGGGGDGISETELHSLREELARSRCEEEERRAVAERLLDENASLKGALGDARSAALNAEGFHSQLAANQEDMHALSRQLQQAEAELRTTQLDMQEKDRSMETLQAAVAAAQRNDSSNEAELASLREENASLQRDLASTAKELAEGREIMLALVGPCDTPHSASAAQDRL